MASVPWCRWGLNRDKVGYNPSAQNAINEKLRRHEDWQLVQVDESTPYRRTIALSTLYDFSNPGEYRVQLDFDNLSVGGADGVEWEGGFDSPVFTVIVKGRK